MQMVQRIDSKQKKKSCDGSLARIEKRTEQSRLMVTKVLDPDALAIHTHRHAHSPALPALPSLRPRALPSRPDFTLCTANIEVKIVTMEN